MTTTLPKATSGRRRPAAVRVRAAPGARCALARNTWRG